MCQVKYHPTSTVSKLIYNVLRFRVFTQAQRNDYLTAQIHPIVILVYNKARCCGHCCPLGCEQNRISARHHKQRGRRIARALSQQQQLLSTTPVIDRLIASNRINKQRNDEQDQNLQLQTSHSFEDDCPIHSTLYFTNAAFGEITNQRCFVQEVRSDPNGSWSDNILCQENGTTHRPGKSGSSSTNVRHFTRHGRRNGQYQ